MKEVSTILKNNTHELQAHYSLRKLGTSLASVMIGLNLFENVTKSNQKVHADTLDPATSDQGSEAQSQTGQRFIRLGKIIPVDDRQNQIKGAKQPHYLRDPNNPDKALPTPVPKIKGYRVAKTGQNDTYDVGTQKVIPPEDPSQDTWLMYQRFRKKVKQTKAKLEQKAAFIRSKQQSPRFSSSRQNFNSQISSNNNEQTLVDNKDQQVEESVQKTKLFGFGRKKKQDSAEETNDNKKIANESEETSKAELKKKADKQVAKIDRKKNAQSAKKNNGNKDHKRKKSAFLNEEPKVIMNSETKIPPKPLLATLKIVDADNDNALLTKLTFEGHQEQPIVFENLKQVVQIHSYDGYETQSLFKEGSDEKIDISDLDHLELGSFGKNDVNFVLAMKHKLIKLTAQNAAGKIAPEELEFETRLTVHYEGAGAQTPKDSIEKAVWTRSKTYDLVTKKVVKGKYDSDWTAQPQAYMAIVAPDIKGYHPDEVETPTLPVIRKSIERVITYHADNDVSQATISKPKEEEQKTQPKLKISFISKDKEPEKKAAASDYEKESSFTVTFAGLGEKNPEKVVQKVKWTRSLKITEKGELVNTPWSQAKEYYDDVDVPVIAGYHADKNQVKGPLVKQADLTEKVTYTANGYFIPVDQMGKQISIKQQFITDPKDASKVLAQENLPEIAGYKKPEEQMTPSDPGKDQRVYYQAIEQFFLVDREHPNDHVAKEEYLRPIHFIVKFVGANEQTPKAVVQTINLVRAVTLNNKGELVPNGKFTTEWQPETASFKAVQIPQIAGYQTKEQVIAGPLVGTADIEKTVKYEPIPEPVQAAESRQRPVGQKPQKPMAASSPTEFLQTIHFVDEAGHQLAKDHQDVIKFDYKKPVETFASVTVPVVNGYYAEMKQVKGKSVMADDEKHEYNITVTYHKMGQIIPVNAQGDVIENNNHATVQVFANDPHDASRALTKQAVPTISGWKAATATVSPIEPGINIPVLYNKKD